MTDFKRSLFLLLLSGLFFTSSCKKVVQSNWSTSNISFKVEGQTKQASGEKNVFATLYKTANIIQIIGNINGSSVEAINLSISNYHGVGEYTAEEDFLGTYSAALDLDHTYIGITGKIKVTSASDTSIKGEFEFTGETGAGANKVISEGKFESKIFSM